MRDILTASVDELVIAGLDYHKDSVQVCVLKPDGTVLLNQKLPAVASRIVAAIEQFGRRAKVALESCSGAATLADEIVALTNWDVQLAHPGYVHRMRQNPDKSDYSDARLLAELKRVGFLPGVWLAPAALRDQRQLVRYRMQLVNERRNVKLRVRALLREWRIAAPKSLWTKAGEAWLRALNQLRPHSRLVLDRHLDNLAQLKLDVCRADQAIRATFADDPSVAALRTEKGVGWITAAVLRTEIGWFTRFKNGKQLSRFCGLSPRNASSGARQADAGLITGCSKLLRATLIEAAHRLMRCQPRWKAFKAQMRERGKPVSVIAAAVANRWVRKLYYDMLPASMKAEQAAAPAA